MECKSNERKIHISKCVELDIVFEDAVSPYGSLICLEALLLMTIYYSKAKEFGIEYIYIFDRNREKIFLNYDSFEERFEANIDKIKHLMNEIIRGKR